MRRPVSPVGFPAVRNGSDLTAARSRVVDLMLMLFVFVGSDTEEGSWASSYDRRN